MLALALALSASAATPNWTALDSDADWRSLGEKGSDVGPVHVRTKRVDGVACVEGSVTVPTPVDALAAVTDQMVTSIEWSQATVALSEELERSGDRFVLFQYFDAPAWTLAADRYWVIAGTTVRDGSNARYTWERIDASGQFPQATARAQALSSSVIEPPTNYGSWSFTQTDAGTALLYRACADFGGRVPASVTQWVNTRQVPGLVSDLVQEADRIGSAG